MTSVQRQETSRTNHHRDERLKHLGRSVGGYALGLVGVAFVGGGLVGGPGSAIVGGAIGGGLLYASRKVMRPLYEQDFSEPLQAQPKESRLRRMGRGLLFAGGMAVNYMGAVLAGNALFGGEAINTAGERILAGGLGVAAWVGGDHLISKSYDPELYRGYDEALQSQQNPATA